MTKVFILLGYASFILYLHITGELSKYINLKYSYISVLAIVFLLILAITQLIEVIKGKKHEHTHDCGCDIHHEHNTEEFDFKKDIITCLFIFPIVTAFLFPTAVLDSNIVKTKGFNFPVSDAEAKDLQRQFLKPDSSFYFSKSQYQKKIKKGLEEIKKDEIINLNDKNYLSNMEVIYQNLQEVKGKEIRLSGFIFNDNGTNKNNAFLFRFGIIHCVADSGVFGLSLEFPKGKTFKNDTWIEVNGIIDQTYSPTVKGVIPIVKVSSWKGIKKPKSPYVYMNY